MQNKLTLFVVQGLLDQYPVLWNDFKKEFCCCHENQEASQLVHVLGYANPANFLFQSGFLNFCPLVVIQTNLLELSHF